MSDPVELVALSKEVGHYHAARYNAVVDLGRDVSVLALRDHAEFHQFLAAERPRCHVQVLQGASDTDTREGVRQVWRALTVLQPRVVAAAGWASAECFAAIRWARRNGRRLVMFSDSAAHDAPREPKREFIKSRIVRACDAALVAGATHRDYIAELGMPPGRVFLGYDVVDNGHFQRGADAARADAPTMRRRHGLPDRYLLASARFIPKKNLSALVAAFLQAREGVADAPHLVVLGDGPERGALEATIRKGGGESVVHLPGFRGYDDLPAYYGLAEGFVHVSTSEQWGLVINEAAAAGLPLAVSAPCGAAGELVEAGRNGFIVNPGDIDDIAAALRRLMGLAPAARAAMGAESRRIVAHWGPERFAMGLEAAVGAALTQPARRLAPWDEALLLALSRRPLTGVP